MLRSHKLLMTVGLLLQFTRAWADEPCSVVPDGWMLEKSSRSGVLCAELITETGDEGKRALRVFESGKEVARSQAIVPCRECGGLLGDPFQSLGWKNEVLTVENFSGSRESWRESWKIARRSGNWFLIGWDRNIYDTATDSSWNESVNTVTKQAVVKFTPGSDKGPLKQLCRDQNDPTQCEHKRIRNRQHIQCAVPDVSGEIGRLPAMRSRAYSCGLITP